MPPQTSYGQQQPAQQSYGQQPPAQAPYGAAPSGYGAGAPPQQPYGAQSSSHPSSMQPGSYSQGPLAGQQGQGQGGYGAPPGPPPTGARPTSGQYGQGAPPAAGAPPPYGAPPPEKASYGAPTQQGYGQQPPAAQQAYGQPAGGAYGGAQQSPRPGGGGVSAMQIQQVLEGCVREQKLNAFCAPRSGEIGLTWQTRPAPQRFSRSPSVSRPRALSRRSRSSGGCRWRLCVHAFAMALIPGHRPLQAGAVRHRALPRR